MNSEFDRLYGSSLREAEEHCRHYLLLEALWAALATSSDPAVTAAFTYEKIDRELLLRQLRDLAKSKSAALGPCEGPDVIVGQDSSAVLANARARAAAAGRTEPTPIDLLEELAANIQPEVNQLLQQQ